MGKVWKKSSLCCRRYSLLGLRSEGWRADPVEDLILAERQSNTVFAHEPDGANAGFDMLLSDYVHMP